MSKEDPKVRDQLKRVRDQLAEKRDSRQALRVERDQAKAAFGEADFAEEGKITETKAFKDAEDATRRLGTVDDEIATLEQAEVGILEMLGESSNGNGNEPGRASNPALEGTGGRWNASALLASSPGYGEAVERGIFRSRHQFGTVELGEIASRENFMASLPAAPSGQLGTTADTVPPDWRGIIPTPLRRLSFLDIIPTGTTDSNSVEYVQVTAIPQSAAEVAEFATKPEEGMTLEMETAPVRTIAGWQKVARNALDDTAGLATIINTLLPYDVRRRLETQMISGDGAGVNLKGITKFTGLGQPAAISGSNQADAILTAMTAVILSDADPNFVATDPLTWQALLMMKSVGSGEYLYGQPSQLQAPTIWGLAITPVRVVGLRPLVGDAAGATLLVREGVNVRTSDSDQDDFVRNRVTVLAETRVALPVWRPSAFAYAPAV